MPRHPRFLPPDNYYHIMNRGNNHMPIFTRDQDYAFYLEKLAELKLEHPFDLYHYCLMGTHLHLLVRTTKETDFSNFSKRLNVTAHSPLSSPNQVEGRLSDGRSLLKVTLWARSGDPL